MKKVLMSGNDAVVEGAIRADLDCYFGYPITPQNEITAGMSARLPEIGKVFLQSESELAAISMVHGAAAAGVRTMTTSSSPGVALMQEGISYIAGSQIPAVVVNIQRGGPGLGNIGAAQGDYFQATRGGGNGDYRTVVLAPSTVQEMLDFTTLAFDIADRYSCVVMVLGDGRLGQMMEPVEMTKAKKVKRVKKKWALTGAKGRKPNIVKSLYLPIPELAEHNQNLLKTYSEIAKNEIRYEEYKTRDADVTFAAYGTCARLCREAVDILRTDGLKAGLLRPVTLWPFPEKVFARKAFKTHAFLVVEMSSGQMEEDVKLAANGNTLVEFFGKMGGDVPTVTEVVKTARKVFNKISRQKSAKRIKK